MLGLKIGIICFVMMADMAGGKPLTVSVPDETPAAVVETTAAPTDPVALQTAATPVPEAPRADGFIAYRIYGRDIPLEWQRYLYDKLAERGYAWYWPYAVCQIWAESCWNQWSDNGRDFGLTQQKGIYWASRAAYWGIPGADIWDPYAQLHVYACMMCGFLASRGGSVEWALSDYFLGTGEYSEFYVGIVLSHLSALEERK